MIRSVSLVSLLAPVLIFALSLEAHGQEDEGILHAFEKKFSVRSAKKRAQAHELLDVIRDRFTVDSEGGPSSMAGKRFRVFARRLTEEPVRGTRVKAEFRISSKATKEGRGERDPFPFPADVSYRFGTRELRHVDPDLERAVKAANQKEGELHPHELSPSTRLRALLLGASPDLELQWIALVKALDQDRGGDRFGQFLTSWRNVGPGNVEETFYEALDRTAGTQESVFFYDAMLAGYTKAFDVTTGLRSTDAAHDHLGRAFLCYRTYRSFVEAVAWCLLLPPDVALPSALDRYDYGASGPLAPNGLFLLRHRIHMLLGVHDGDPEPVIAFVTKVLAEHPLPEDLGSTATSYAPLGAFEKTFQAAHGSLGVAALEKVVQAERELAARLRESTIAELDRLEIH